MENMNSYNLSRFFWDFAFENPSKIKPIHCAIYFFSMEHCNRLGWKKEFGLPTSMVIEAIGVKSYSVYKSAFDDLVEYNFFEVLQYSKNQYSSNIIALKENSKANTKANTKALDKALQKHSIKQSKSSDSIDKQVTNNQITNNTCFSFDDFWIMYAKSSDKTKCKSKYDNLVESERQDIKIKLPIYLKTITDKKYQKNPLTYLNGKCWNDIEDIQHTEQQSAENFPKFTIKGNTLHIL